MGIFNVRGGAEEEEEDVKVAAEPVEEKEEGPTEAETATETPAKEEAATEAETDGETEASKAKEEEEESDEEEEEETEEESDEEESDAEEEEVADVTQDMSVETSEFDEPLVMSPMIQLYATFGVMMLARKVDMTSPTVVKFARFAYIAYLVLLQAFVLYVRFRAKAINDRTPLQVSNPLSNLVKSQIDNQDNAMVKNLASSFLSSATTILEYDLKEAKSMQSGLLFGMCFMWFLHFKMQQMQPLMVGTFTGIAQMVYNPLFQVYVFGRNLERPFKNPGMSKFQLPEEEEVSASEMESTETAISEEEEEAAAEEAEEEEESGAESDDESTDDSEDEE